MIAPSYPMSYWSWTSPASAPSTGLSDERHSTLGAAGLGTNRMTFPGTGAPDRFWSILLTLSLLGGNMLRKLPLFLLSLLLTPLIFAQSGAVLPTEQVYRFAVTTDQTDQTKDFLCTATIVSDCVTGVRFFYFLGGQKVTHATVPVSALTVSAGIATARAPLPQLTGRYNSGTLLYAETVAVDLNGVEITAVPLALSYQKRPAQGVEFKLQ